MSDGLELVIAVGTVHVGQGRAWVRPKLELLMFSGSPADHPSMQAINSFLTITWKTFLAALVGTWLISAWTGNSSLGLPVFFGLLLILAVADGVKKRLSGSLQQPDDHAPTSQAEQEPGVTTG